MRTLATFFLIIILGLAHPLTQAVQTVDEFCSDLGAVNSHLTSNFTAYFNVSFSVPFECRCNTTAGPGTLVVDCVGTYDNIDALETSREQAILKANSNGTVFTLVQTAWSDTFYDSIDILQGIYVFEDGEQVSCTTTGCASCSICSDGTSIEVDCSTLAADFEYTSECSEKYMGAFISSFGFPIIIQDVSQPSDNTSPTARPAVSPTAGPVSSLPPPAEPQTPEDFCEDLSDLEVHMKSSFEEIVFALPAENNYDCECTAPLDASMLPDCNVRYGADVCTNPNDFALIIDCSMFYGDADEPFINFEQAVFEKSSNDTKLELWRTGWGDTSISIGLQEFFFFENGSLDECFRRNTSDFEVCAVCPDGESLAFCSNDLGTCDIPCSDMYTGAFFNTYDLALLTAPMDTVSATLSPTMAPTGSPIMADAPTGNATSNLTVAPTGSPTMADAPPTSSPADVVDAPTNNSPLAPYPAPAVSPAPASGGCAGGLLQPAVGCLLLVAAVMTLS